MGPSILMTCAKDLVAMGTWGWGGVGEEQWLLPSLVGKCETGASLSWGKMHKVSQRPQGQRARWRGEVIHGCGWRLKQEVETCADGSRYEWPWNPDSGGTECMVQRARSHSCRTRESHKWMQLFVPLLGTSGRQAAAGPVNLCGRFQMLSDDSLSLWLVKASGLTNPCTPRVYLTVKRMFH